MVTKRAARNEVQVVCIPLDSRFCGVEGTDVGPIPRSGVDSARRGTARTTSLGSTMEPASLLPSLRARRSFGGRWSKFRNLSRSPMLSLGRVEERRWWVITDGWTRGFVPFRANARRGENPSPYCKHLNWFLSLPSLHAQRHAYPLPVSSVHFALTDPGATARLFVQVVSYLNTSPPTSIPISFFHPLRWAYLSVRNLETGKIDALGP